MHLGWAMKSTLWKLTVIGMLSGCVTQPIQSGSQASTTGDVPTQMEAPTQIISEIRPILEMSEVPKWLTHLPTSFKTLLVFDIDDTLLTTPRFANGQRQFFGSDRWYLWQSDTSLSDHAASADQVPCLYDVIAMNYEVGTQEPTEPHLAQTIAALPGDKLLLTSRNPDYRDATERELKEAGFNLPIVQMLGNATDGKGFRTENGTFATYINGIYMTKGGNKGDMLLQLLSQIGLDGYYDAVVLIDDSQNKLEDMQRVLLPKGISFYGLRYEGIKPYPVPNLTMSQLADARQGWLRWKKFMREQYPARLKRLNHSTPSCKEKPYAL